MLYLNKTQTDKVYFVNFDYFALKWGVFVELNFGCVPFGDFPILKQISHSFWYIQIWIFDLMKRNLLGLKSKEPKSKFMDFAICAVLIEMDLKVIGQTSGISSWSILSPYPFCLLDTILL